MPSHECMIIVNPESKAWDFAYSIYKNLNLRDKKYGIDELNITTFRDKEIKTKIKENIRRKNCFFIHDSSLEPAEWFMQLAIANQTMKNSSAQEIRDILPYLKFSRQDRKDESRVGLNAKVVADSINKYANSVLTIDVHNPAIQLAYEIPLDNLYSSNVLLANLKEKHPYLLENIVIMSPDIGGASRARAFANKLGIKNIAIGWKYKHEQEIEEYIITGNVSDRNVLLIDDIVDSGSTIVAAAEEARKQGAKKIYAYCTHGVFSGNARDKVSNSLDLMIVSNSIPQPKHEKIEVIQLENFFAEAIYRINEGKSLSQLFE